MFTENIFLTIFGFVSINVTTNHAKPRVTYAQKKISVRSIKYSKELRKIPNNNSKKKRDISNCYLKGGAIKLKPDSVGGDDPSRKIGRGLGQ